jgi:hypothetical protein
VCLVSGVLYHLRVNVAEGDIRCVTGEDNRRLMLCLRFCRNVSGICMIRSSQGSQERLRYGHFAIGLSVHSSGF